jgi:hypothetical protein
VRNNVDLSRKTQHRSIHIANLDLSQSSNLSTVYVAELDLRTTFSNCLSVGWVLCRIVSGHMESVEFTIKTDVSDDLQRLDWDAFTQVFSRSWVKVVFAIRVNLS